MPTANKIQDKVECVRGLWRRVETDRLLNQLHRLVHLAVVSALLRAIKAVARGILVRLHRRDPGSKSDEIRRISDPMKTWFVRGEIGGDRLKTARLLPTTSELGVASQQSFKGMPRRAGRARGRERERKYAKEPGWIVCFGGRRGGRDEQIHPGGRALTADPCTCTAFFSALDW